MGFFQPKWKTVNNKKADQAIACVRKIEDQDCLKTIAFEAPLDSVASAAVDQISDPDLLRQIALEARPDPAQAAIKKITDTALLKRIVLEYEDGRNEIAVTRISDQQVLKEIVLNAKGQWTKVSAAKCIRDADIARDLVQKDMDGVVISALIPHIDDRQLLKEIYCRYYDELYKYSYSLYRGEIRIRFNKLKDAKQQENLDTLDHLFNLMMKSPSKQSLSLVCPECGGELVCLAAWLKDDKSGEWDDIYWTECKTCNYTSFNPIDPYPADFVDASLVLAEHPSSGNLSVCPRCRRRRIDYNDKENITFFGIGPQKSCDCSKNLQQEYAPVNIEIIRTQWVMTEYQCAKLGYHKKRHYF